MRATTSPRFTVVVVSVMENARLPQLSAVHKAYSQRQIYDGKRMRKAVTRRTIDYAASILRMMESDVLLKRNLAPPILPTPAFVYNYSLPIACQYKPMDSIPMKHIRTSMNKVRTPINIVRFTPDGKRLITGAATGEFTLWSGVGFNFETIMQAHDGAIRAMTWAHDSNFMLTGDHSGTVKYWQPSMNNIKNIQAHAEPVRNICFSPEDGKFASCSDDGHIKIWDFGRAEEERTLQGHGWDVKALDWHPYMALLASGSKDNLIKLWDPKSGANLATLHGHKNSILDLRFNRNGNWMVTSGKDQLIKVFDLRTMREFVTFKGHKKEINTLAWHPIHETLFSSAAGDGTIMHWLTTCPHEHMGLLEGAHENIIWSLDWHPLGHVLASGSADTSTRFWTRHRPADSLTDVYNLGKQAAEALGIKISAPQPDDDDANGEDEVDMLLPGLGMLPHGSNEFRDNRREGRDSRGEYQDSHRSHSSRNDQHRPSTRYDYHQERRDRHEPSSRYGSTRPMRHDEPPPPPPPRQR